MGCAAHDSVRVDLGRWVQLRQQSRVVEQALDTVDWFWERLELGDEAVELGGHVGLDRKSTRLNSSHLRRSRMPSSA